MFDVHVCFYLFILDEKQIGLLIAKILNLVFDLLKIENESIERVN